MRVLAAVAHHGSVTRAATSLHLTGPGVSQHLRRLEREVGATLVERDGRSIRLTPAGRALAYRATAMAEHARHAEGDVARIDSDVAGDLRIGAVASALRHLVVPALAELVERHPSVTPTLVDGEGVDLLELLSRKSLDAVVFESWDTHPASLPRDVTAPFMIRTDVVHLAVPTGGDRAAQALRDLVDRPWAVCPAGSDAHTALIQLFRQFGGEPRIAHQVSDYATQLALVEAGLAFALIPETARDRHAAVDYVPTDPVVTRSLRFATSADIPAVNTLRDMLTAVPQG